MRILFTEIVGWVLTLAGLGLVGLIIILALNRNVFEATALSLPAVIVFRSGIGLVRMATAGRIAMGIVNQEESATV